MDDALYNYILDTENPEKNFALAIEYKNIGQTAAAVSYFLRAADRTTDLNLAYECLLHMAVCFNSQKNRDYTVRGLYQHAIATLPKRPEAYFLYARYLEWTKQYAESYTTCNIALSTADFDLPSLKTDVDYPGKYGVIFQKAVSSYWWGKGIESRKLFYQLVDEYWDVMHQQYKNSVEDNIARLGSGLQSQASILYNKKDHSKLRFKFDGSEKIERNYSQVYQDMFVLSALNGKTNGTYVEIGGGKPCHNNNTWILENEFDWTGFSLETNQEFVNEYRKQRKNSIFSDDALTVNYKKLFEEHFKTKEIDYLQLDIEPAKNTFECLLSIPFEEYKFAVITYEHDYYVDVTKSYREKSRRYLKMMGYELVVNDISPDGISNFEDWWVHPDLVNPKIIKIMKDLSSKTKKVDNYFLSTKYYAEFETDKYIRENFFPDQTYEGVFVEVGAGPPEFLSNSKHFRDYGWRTICVEPNPKFVEQHQECQSEVYEYACCNSEGKSTFVINHNNDDWYTSENDGVSFSALDIRYKDVPEHNTQKTIEVETIKLNTLLEKIKIKKVDVLSIDTEGWELDVMNGFDVSKYNPKVIVLENFEKNAEYETYMEIKGYKKQIDLGYNQIYIKNQ